MQQKEGLGLRNKLISAHIAWSKAKTKVVQTLSASVADAIEFCDKDLKMPQFAGSEVTVHFIRIIERVFGTLNSRDPCSYSHTPEQLLGG